MEVCRVIMKELPKEISINKLKDMFSLLMQTFSEVYVDAFGVVRGLTLRDYIISTANIQVLDGQTYSCMRDRYIALGLSYKTLKDLKKRDARAVYDDNGILIGIININDEIVDMKSPGIWFYKQDQVPSFGILFEKYEQYPFLYSSPESFVMKNVTGNDLEYLKTQIDSGKIVRLMGTLSIDKTFIPKPSKLVGFGFGIYSDKSPDNGHDYWKLVCGYADATITVYIKTVKMEVN